MKAILSLFTSLLLLCSQLVYAQQFSPTTGVPCPNCVPANYNAIGTPFISDIYNPGIDVTKTDYQWYIYMGELDLPPSTYSQGLAVGSGKNSFVSLKTSEGAVNDKLFLDVSGFDVNKTYVLRYSVCGAAFYKGSNSQSPSPDAESATMEIVTGGQYSIVVASQTTNFNSNNQQHWTERALTFTPAASTLRFRLSGKTPGQTPGYVHFSIDKYPFDCKPSNVQVELQQPIIETPFKGDKLDLSTVQIKGAAPANNTVTWKSGPNSTDPTLTGQLLFSAPVSNLDPANVKPYYAFYYATELNCYNPAVSQAQLKFMYVPAQVPLKQTYVAVSCTQPTTDLTSLLDNPVGQVLWFTTNDHQSGSAVQNPQAVGAGDYYAFYYNSGKGGYSLAANQVSNAHVKVENPILPGTPDLGPTLDINSLLFPANGSKDFVVNIYNSAENSNCSVFFRILKLPGFTITYSTAAGTSNVNGGVFNNNDFWTFSEDANFITVTSKYGIAANGYSAIGFKITRKANTPANSAQNITVTIPQQGGGGEINTANNAVMNTVTGI